MYIQKRRLCLVDAQKIVFDGDEGQKITKWKYTFLTPENTLMEAWDDAGLYSDISKIRVLDSFKDDQADDYLFEGKVWKGATRWKLAVAGLRKK